MPIVAFQHINTRSTDVERTRDALRHGGDEIGTEVEQRPGEQGDRDADEHAGDRAEQAA